MAINSRYLPSGQKAISFGQKQQPPSKKSKSQTKILTFFMSHNIGCKHPKSHLFFSQIWYNFPVYDLQFAIFGIKNGFLALFLK